MTNTHDPWGRLCFMLYFCDDYGTVYDTNGKWHDR